MTFNFQRLMTEAAAFTRNGDLQAATAALQSALAANAAAAGSSLAGSSLAGSLPTGLPLSVAPFGTLPFASALGADIARVMPLDVPMPLPAQPPGTPSRGGAAAADNGTAAGARFIDGEFSCTAGRRAYKLYIPPQAGSKPLPMVVMLHGCTQSPDDFAAGTAMNDAALAQGFFVLYPAQSQDANPQRCWNWFKHSHQQRGRGEPLLLAGMTRQVMATQAIDPQRIYVAGLSAGGAMAAILGDSYPELFAAVGVHSGLAAGAATDLPSALSAMRSGAPARSAGTGRPAPPTIVFHGSADTTVHPANGEQAAVAGNCAGGDCIVVPVPAAAGKRAATRQLYQRRDGSIGSELWLVDGAPHAWSGGRTAGSYTDPRGPDATHEMLRFFFERPLQAGPAQ